MMDSSARVPNPAKLTPLQEKRWTGLVGTTWDESVREGVSDAETVTRAWKRMCQEWPEMGQVSRPPTRQELAASRKKPFDDVFAGVFWLTIGVSVFLGLMYLGLSLWQDYTENRTATIRAVTWNNNAHMIYMNDGTVWDAQPQGVWFATGVKPLIGDEVRYVYAKQKIADPADLPSPLPDVCDLNDLTLGQKYTAVRLSAPYTHSSCPER